MRRWLSLSLVLTLVGCQDGPVTVTVTPGSPDKGLHNGQVPPQAHAPFSKIDPADLSKPLDGRPGRDPFAGDLSPLPADPGADPVVDPSQPAQGATKLSAKIIIDRSSSANRGKLRLEVVVPRGDKQSKGEGQGKGKTFKTKALDVSEIAYVDVSVAGIGISTPIKAVGGLLPVPVDGKVTVDLEVPTGVSRVVTLLGYDASQQLVEGSAIKGLLDVTPIQPVTTEVSWRTHVSGLIMERLISQDPLTASLLRAADLQTQVDSVVQPAGAFPYSFGLHPSLVKAEKWADDILAANSTNPPGSPPLLPAPNAVTLVPGEIAGVLDGLPAGTEVSIGSKDPASATLTVAVTGSNQAYRLSGITPGTWPVWFSWNGDTWLRTVQVAEASSATLDWRAPVIGGFSPTYAAAGATVVVSGRNFGAGGSVTVGGIQATVKSWADNRLEVTVPGVSAGSAPVLVTRDDFPSQAQSLNVLGGAPVLTRINPTSNSLSVPRSIVLTGNNYSPVAAENVVRMVSGSTVYVPDVTLVNANNLAFSSPNTVGTYTVTVAVGGLTSNAFTYTVTP